MEDSDSGVTSMSGKSSSVGGDDRSGAGSRSSAASLAFSEVSSPAPILLYAGSLQQQQQQQQPLALTVPRASSTEPVRVWRDPQLLESSPTVVRHIHSMQHHALMMAPGGHYEEEKSTATTAGSRDRSQASRGGGGGGIRDMERGKDVDRERMVHHIQRERERIAGGGEAEDAVNKHFEESLKKYQSQMSWNHPVQHGVATGASPPRSAPLGAGISPSLSISSIPATNLGTLNISPSPANNSANKKGFVKTSGNVSNKSSDSVVGGHVIDHHSRGPTDVIGLSSAARNGLAAHYDPYAAEQIALDERRVRERILMADRELVENDQHQRMQQQQQHHHHHQQQQQQQQQHQQREREKEIDRMRHLEQQRAAVASYYGQAAAAAAAAANVHRPPSSSSSSSATNGGSNKSTSSISVTPTSSPAGSLHNNGSGGNPSSVSIDYAHHRGLTISPSMKHVDKAASAALPQQQQQQQQATASIVGHPMYAYQQHLYQPMAYHKDAKGKPEMPLPAPPPLMSDLKSSSGGGVIVKHDGGPMKSQQMPASLQVIPTSSMGNSGNSNKSLPSPNHYKQGAPPPTQSQLLFEYRNPTAGSGPPNIVSIHTTSRDPSPQSHQPQMIYTDRYKMQAAYASQQQQQQGGVASQQRQSPASSVGYQQRQAPSPKQLPSAGGYAQVTTQQQTKPKVSSPAPSHIYGKPESGPQSNPPLPSGAAGIMSGIPVCRAGPNYAMPSMHVVSKPSMESTRIGQGGSYPPPPSAAVPSQRSSYGASGPPPAHSSAWHYGTTAGPPPPHSSLLQSSAPPVSISVNPSPASMLNRSPTGQINTHSSSGHSISISVSPSVSHVPDVQTQPLDLGTSDRSRDSMHSNHSSESKSPPVATHGGLKRKSNTPIHYHHAPSNSVSAAQAAAADMKKKRIEFIPQPQHQHNQQHQMAPSQYHHPYPPHPPAGAVHHPSYSVYQSIPGSVAIHPIPNPNSQPMMRKDVAPPISVVVSVNEAHQQQQKSIPMEGHREIFKGQSGTAVVTTHPVVSNSITITSRSEVSPAVVVSTAAHATNEREPAITITTSTLAPMPAAVNSKPVAVNNYNLSNNNNNSSSSPSSTPIKLPISEPAKSVSPSLKFSHSGPRNLKKAWLQRHSGEDAEDKVPVTGTGPSSASSSSSIGGGNESVINKPPANGLNNGNGLSGNNATATGGAAAGGGGGGVVKQENVLKSISSVGSMAVNSVTSSAIGMDVQPSSNGNKVPPPQHPKKTAVLNNNNNNNNNNNSAEGKGKMAVDSDSDAQEDSSSSDQEHAIKTPPKKKQAKSKRKKGGGAAGGRKPIAKKKRGTAAANAAAATRTTASESDKNSDSDKSASDRESDSGTSTSQGRLNRASNGSAEKNSPAKSDVSERRKRGRRPKVTKDTAAAVVVPLKKKQSKPGQANASVAVRGRPKSPVVKTFLQEKACHEMVEKLPKCRECRLPTDQRMKAFCRFYAFRRLRYTKHNQLAVSGFSDPKKTPSISDRRLWETNRTNPPTDLDLSTARFILSKISLQLCSMLSSEMSVWNEHRGGRRAWKKVVNGMREMCDVCETTLFNLHWSCNKCGLAVCLDCCKSRRDGCAKSWSESEKDCDEYRWLLCTNGGVHDPNKLTSTQIMTGNTMGQMDKELHHICNFFGIKLQCQCTTTAQVPHELVELALRTVYFAEKHGMKARKVVDQRVECDSPLSVLADVALQQNSRKSKGPDKSAFDHEMLKLCQAALRKYPNLPKPPVIKKEPKNDDGEDGDEEDEDEEANFKLLPAKVKIEMIPIRVMNIAESKVLYPDTPHSWLCDGKLLRLHDPTSPNNLQMFQEQWMRGQPVIVSDVTKKLNRELWTPESFSSDFGDKKHDVVNCINGDVISMPMKKFWDGFDTTKRLKDDKGQPMLLKLKDWPPDENFATMLPERFDDLMAALPLKEYTHRNGRLNLAGRLPSCFVRPDLGPKMYNAYGSALHPTKGTTNLHMDISDAVNVMVYVGIPKGVVHTEETKEAFRAIDEAGCDILTRRRVRDKGEMPGALWHIYAPQDADKIRQLLREVAVERGENIEPDSDPIHDQNWYLDGPLRERLYKSYGVEGYPIAQCLGDAIFIPAGAPHQVRNLHNCIKVAEDFVSPENISNCFQLTHEFRQLSDSHQNHEDKLQIKNIIYHAAKDVLSYLFVRLKRAEEWGVAPDDEFTNWKSTYEPWVKPKLEEAERDQ